MERPEFETSNAGVCRRPAESNFDGNDLYVSLTDKADLSAGLQCLQCKRNEEGTGFFQLSILETIHGMFAGITTPSLTT